MDEIKEAIPNIENLLKTASPSNFMMKSVKTALAALKTMNKIFNMAAYDNYAIDKLAQDDIKEIFHSFMKEEFEKLPEFDGY